MRFVYQHKEYEVLELHDIQDISFEGMVVLFEIQYASYNGKGERTRRSEEEFLSQDDDEKNLIICEEKKFVNYFPIDSREHDYIIENCQYFIDHRYGKNFDPCGYYLMNLKKAIVEFEDDLKNDYSTKGSLDGLEYAQSDIYDWVKENIELEGEND